MTQHDSPQSLEDICVAKGMRMTEQRRIIARVIEGASDHPDVEELYRRAVENDPRISISTVYRTVKLFEDAGIIERHDFRDGRARYETVPEEHHDHLIDLKSGRVIEFRNEEIEQLQEAIARKLGYRLVDHRLELYGIPLGGQPVDTDSEPCADTDGEAG
ncbi:transcriptional repressor [Stappia taiwanensis]|uniref:Ferric uptake regulation protein n=1 Tax=Stappia taiwanensis TaxID=992267 RepID=A0A838XP68_9HYPH|nr:Fur family transcriptional regulator [Stappia taiwanensis]MBA4613049.1 transcriptional repressor [Stappia taiwanensis]GGF01654.1 transcriptional repressor [Stappia taiwanensis]